MGHQFHWVDVFTNRPFGGNPLAVFTDGASFSSDQMQQIAAELNLSETTFVLPPTHPECDFKVRIFTPAAELPMAGHPTVGTAFVLAREGLIATNTNHAVFEEGVGPIPLTLSWQEGQLEQVTMQQPLPEFGAIFEDRALIALALSISETDLSPELPVQTVSCGVPFLLVPIKNLDAMRRLALRLDVWSEKLNPLGIGKFMAFTTETEQPAHSVHARMFAPSLNISEDPATGGASGPLGSYLVQYGLVDPSAAQHMVSEQGFEMGRPSLIHIGIEGEPNHITRVLVGGQSVYMLSGNLTVELENP